MRNNQRDHLCLHTLRPLALAAVQQATASPPGTPVALAQSPNLPASMTWTAQPNYG